MRGLIPPITSFLTVKQKSITLVELDLDVFSPVCMSRVLVSAGSAYQVAPAPIIVAESFFPAHGQQKQGTVAVPERWVIWPRNPPLGPLGLFVRM